MELKLCLWNLLVLFIQFDVDMAHRFPNVWSSPKSLMAQIGFLAAAKHFRQSLVLMALVAITQLSAKTMKKNSFYFDLINIIIKDLPITKAVFILKISC